MIGVVAFAATLVVAVAISGFARRSILSTAVLFLVAGCAFGHLGADVVGFSVDDPSVVRFTEITLAVVLFTDGMGLGAGSLRSAWRLPGRLLLFGMPLTFAVVALAARLLIGLPWVESMLVAAALAPTDPVLASAIVGRPDVPGRVRRLLNVESGVNDGLALPVVVVLLDLVSDQPIQPVDLVTALLGGIAIGVAVPWVAALLLRVAPGDSTERYEALAPVAIGMLVFAIADLTGANTFLAVFCAGATLASVSPLLHQAFERFGELVSELLKLAALMLFGALLTGDVFVGAGLAGLAFAVVTLTIGRALPATIALLGSEVRGKELFTVAWFGPKGFSSVVYGLFILSSGANDERQIAQLVALTVVVSIVVHSSTDVAIANWLPAPEVSERR